MVYDYTTAPPTVETFLINLKSGIKYDRMSISGRHFTMPGTKVLRLLTNTTLAARH